MPFRPSVHGWPFSTVPAPDPSLTGLGANPNPDPGLGAAMCWAALDRYRTGIAIPRDTPAPAPGDRLHAELIRRQASLAATWSEVRDSQERPSGSWRDRLPTIPLPGPDLGSRTRAAWRGARKRLLRDEPVLLFLLPETDRYRRGVAGWPVLATTMARSGRRVTITLYDPARPNADDVRLVFSLAGPLDARLTGGVSLRGFLVVDCVAPRLAPFQVETFADHAVIGLNRKTHGRLAPATRGARLDIAARDANGALVHFRRRPGRSWVGQNVTEREELGAVELHSDPAAVADAFGFHVFARSYVGDLLHFRLGRAWSVANRTDHRKAGPRFRITGMPVPVSRPHGRLSVFGRHQDGGLIHFSGGVLRPWTAEQVPGEPLASDPVAVATPDGVTVFGLAGNGRLLCWELSGDRWVALDLSTGMEEGPPLRLAGRPVPIRHEGRLHVFGRDTEGRLAHFRQSRPGRWSSAAQAKDVAGDPAPTAGPAGLHVFVANQAGGLLHLWGEASGWRQEDVLASRPALGAGWPVGEWLTAWGAADELRVTGRWGNAPITLAWRPESDWVAVELALRAGVADRHRPADPPLQVTDGAGRPHHFATDGRGTVLHMEEGSWTEPKMVDTTAAWAAITAPPKSRKKDPAPGAKEPAASPTEAEPEAEVETPMDVGEPVAPADDATPDTADDPLPLLTVETADGKEPGGGDDDEESKEPADAMEPMDLTLLDSWPPRPPSLRKGETKEQRQSR